VRSKISTLLLAYGTVRFYWVHYLLTASGQLMNRAMYDPDNPIRVNQTIKPV